MKAAKQWAGRWTRAALVAAVVGMGFMSHASAQNNHWVTVANHSDQSIFRVHYSSIERRNWGPDRLGSDIISAGDERRLNMRDYAQTCRMDVRIVMRDGDEHVINNVNTCAANRIRVYSGSHNYRVE